VGDYVTAGHNCVIHACEIGDRCVVGIGAIVLTGAKVGDDSVIGAGAVVTENTVIPPNSLVLGIPGKVVKEVPETLKDAFAGKAPLERPVRPLVMRYFVLTSHYRSPLDFSGEALQAAGKGLERIENTLARVRRALASAGEGETPQNVQELLAENRKRFLAEMNEDFNTAGALGHLNAFTREVNRLLDSGDGISRGALAAISDHYEELGGRILGIITPQTGQQQSAGLEEELIKTLVDVRNRLRQSGDYEQADSIRKRLNELGIALKDGPQGTTWSYT